MTNVNSIPSVPQVVFPSQIGDITFTIAHGPWPGMWVYANFGFLLDTQMTRLQCLMDMFAEGTHPEGTFTDTGSGKPIRATEHEQLTKAAGVLADCAFFLLGHPFALRARGYMYAMGWPSEFPPQELDPAQQITVEDLQRQLTYRQDLLELQCADAFLFQACAVLPDGMLQTALDLYRDGETDALQILEVLSAAMLPSRPE